MRSPTPPGWLKKLEDRVQKHEATLNRAAGIGALLGTMFTLLHIGVDYVKAKR